MTIPVRPENNSYSGFKFFDLICGLPLNQRFGNVKEIVVKKNEYIYNPSSEHMYIYEIVDGAVKLGSYTDEGEEFTFDVLIKDDFFGDLKYLNNQFFEFSKALVDTRLRIYSRDFFKKMVVHNPQVSEWFMSYLVKRWCSAEKKLKKLQEKKVTDKLSFLSSFFNLKIRDAKGVEYIILDLLTQKDRGNLIGATRQTVANSSKNNGDR
ncbi:Crp/Fnr family transcriptional regulator [Algoriphagus sp.]|uniref:Crp/Fnr family transcriptional regulator n=1 Tax=Algoriphagus sp. TaxID=1872435 RepID=UPI003289D23B